MSLIGKIHIGVHLVSVAIVFASVQVVEASTQRSVRCEAHGGYLAGKGVNAPCKCDIRLGGQVFDISIKMTHDSHCGKELALKARQIFSGAHERFNPRNMCQPTRICNSSNGLLYEYHMARAIHIFAKVAAIYDDATTKIVKKNYGKRFCWELRNESKRNACQAVISHRTASRWELNSVAGEMKSLFEKAQRTMVAYLNDLKEQFQGSADPYRRDKIRYINEFINRVRTLKTKSVRDGDMGFRFSMSTNGQFIYTEGMIALLKRDLHETAFLALLHEVAHAGDLVSGIKDAIGSSKSIFAVHPFGNSVRTLANKAKIINRENVNETLADAMAFEALMSEAGQRVHGYRSGVENLASSMAHHSMSLT